MREATRSVGQMEGMLGPDPLTEALRGRIRGMILALTEAELKEVLGTQWYERSRERPGLPPWQEAAVDHDRPRESCD